MNTREEQLTYIIHNFGELTVFSPQELVEGSGLSRQLTNNNLKKLCVDSILEQRGRGAYVLLNRANAIDYLVRSKQVIRAADRKDVERMALSYPEFVQKVMFMIDLSQALRSLGIPGYQNVTRRYADFIREDIETLKRVVIAIERPTVTDERAVEWLKEQDGGLESLGQRLVPYLGMSAELFKATIRTHEERVALTSG